MTPSTLRSVAVGLGLTVTLAIQTADRTNAAQIPFDAVVQFGAAHPQPAPPSHHVLVPDEVTILKGGTVAFQVNGGGHGVAIYPVHRSTSREDVLADLCPDGPGCPAAAAFPPFTITDAKEDSIVEVGPFANIPFYDYAPARLLAAIGGSGIFLNGSTAAPVPPAIMPAPGVLLVHRFEKTGRFLVICTNRFHAFNDHMFGFVNVVGGDD